jgi:hypothetical protein
VGGRRVFLGWRQKSSTDVRETLHRAVGPASRDVRRAEQVTPAPTTQGPLTRPRLSGSPARCVGDPATPRPTHRRRPRPSSRGFRRSNAARIHDSRFRDRPIATTRRDPGQARATGEVCWGGVVGVSGYVGFAGSGGGGGECSAPQTSSGSPQSPPTWQRGRSEPTPMAEEGSSPRVWGSLLIHEGRTLNATGYPFPLRRARRPCSGDRFESWRLVGGSFSWCWGRIRGGRRGGGWGG